MSLRDTECVDALCRSAQPLQINAAVIRSRSWSSALFVGERLTVSITADDDEALDAWLPTLPDAELALRGGFVASLDVAARDTGRATLDILVIDGD